MFNKRKVYLWEFFIIKIKQYVLKGYLIERENDYNKLLSEKLLINNYIYSVI